MQLAVRKGDGQCAWGGCLGRLALHLALAGLGLRLLLVCLARSLARPQTAERQAPQSLDLLPDSQPCTWPLQGQPDHTDHQHVCLVFASTAVANSLVACHDLLYNALHCGIRWFRLPQDPDLRLADWH